jgi:trigger factor
MHHDHAHDVEVKKVDRISPTQVRLTIAFSGAQVAQHEKKMAERYTREAAIPGFRPGKAPMKMVMEKYRDRIRQDVVSHLLEAGLSEAIQQTKLVPINRPKIEMGQVSFAVEAPLEFHAEFEIEPEVQVKAYKGVPLKKADTAVTDEEVEKTIETLRERMGVLEPSDETKPKKGSFAVVEVAYALKDDPSKSEPTSSFTVELGNDKLIPEIDAAFMSMTVGESREVQGTFPADYHEKDLAGKTAIFQCKILELKTRTLPEVNDQFAESVRPGTTLLSLKSDIRKNIEGTKAQQSRRAQRQEIIDYLVSKNGFDVPKSMIDNQSRKLLENMAQDLKSRGQALPPLKEDEMQAVRSSAEEIVRGGLLLKRIAIQENIELSEEKVLGRVTELAKQWNQKPEETQKFLESQGVLDRVRDEVLTDQIFDFLVENAKSA